MNQKAAESTGCSETATHRESETPALVLEGLNKTYGKLKALADLSLQCPKATTTVILGPSGAGKTTTLELIAGLKEPDSGNIRINGRLVNGLEPKDRNVAMVFEQYSLYPHLSVFENVASPLRIEKHSARHITERVTSVTGMLGIGDFLKRKPRNLSGGQRQRVALARCLVKSANVFLMDEPISHLDAKLRHQMRGEFGHIQEELGITILYVTHDWREALALADTVLVLNKGVVEQIGTPNDVYERPANSFVAQLVGEPPMNFFHGTVEEANGQRIFASDGCQIALHHPATPEGEAIVGIRPCDIELTEPTEAKIAEGEVYAFEYFGHEAILTIQIGEQLVKVKMKQAVTSETFEIGERVCFAFDPTQCHVFDPDGIRISYPMEAMA